MKLFPGKQLQVARGVIFAFVVFIGCRAAAVEKENRVLYVIDGDTIIVKIGGRKEKVRFIGIDTPETPHDGAAEYCGPEATEYTRKALRGGRVRLAFDRERRDKYGRLLAYVYAPTGQGGKNKGQEMFLNEKLLESGLARLMTIPPNTSKIKRFAAAEKSARARKKGVWSGGGCSRR